MANDDLDEKILLVSEAWHIFGSVAARALAVKIGLPLEYVEWTLAPGGGIERIVVN
jgi:hypothetical protein